MSSGLLLRVHQIGRRIHVLGPGTRFCIWTQGCNQRCPGCLAPEAQPLDGGYTVPTDELAKHMIEDDRLQGITISGGEPFLQAEALSALLGSVHQTRDLGVIVYTGYLLEDLQANVYPGSKELLSHVDLLIDGPYVEALNDDGALRGSSNQRVIPLTDRYASVLSQYGKPGQRQTELMVTDEQFFMAGVPSRATAKFMNQFSGRSDKK